MAAQRVRVGRQIRRARIHAGLSHDKLAAAAGTGRQHLIKLEKGQHLPSDALLARIAEATGKSIEFFMSDDDEEADSMALLATVLHKAVREAVELHAQKVHA